MSFEEMQKAWQAQDARLKVTINAELLLREVRHNQRHFRATILWRDVREVGVCALLTIAFFAWGFKWHWWSLYLLSFCCLFVGAFFVVDRRLQRRKQPLKNDTLQACVQNSLFQLNHQIWLLKNVFWWYLLPFAVGLVAVAGTVVWYHRADGTGAHLAVTYAVTYGVTFFVIYLANQHAVRKQLEPRRKELEEILAALN